MELIRIEHDGCIDHINPNNINYIARHTSFSHSTIYFSNGYSLEIPNEQAAELIQVINDIKKKEKENYLNNLVDALVKANIPTYKIRDILRHLNIKEMFTQCTII
jgi:hypothetical protein